VDLGAPQKLNQYLYVSGGENSDIVSPRNRPPQLTLHSPSGAQFRKEVLPGLGQRMIVTAQCEKTPRLELTVCLWDGSPRVDICDRLTRTETRALEAAYFAFPFAARDPELRIEIPNGVMRPEVDQLPGACREWFCLQNWLRLRDAGGGVVWSSPDAPLVCLGDINRGLWREKIAVKDGRVYSYLMNNYWDTNYKASQGGDFEFRYSFQPQDAGGDAEAARAGWQSSTGLQATVLPAAQVGQWAGRQVSLCRVRPGCVVVTAIKPAAAGNGVVVRLLSLADRELTAEVEMRTPTRAAVLCNLMEEPVRPLPVAGSTVRVSLAPLRPTTVLMK
jgi:alpha-mannosidase